MRRIGLAVILALGLALSPLVAETQEPGKVYRVGRLSVSDAEPTSSEAFRRGLRELGWVVDQNVVVEQRNAGGDLKRLAAVAAELVRMNVDVIVAAGSDSVEAAFRATKSIPIVMAVGTDPERRGWIKSLGRAGGSVAGVVAFLPGRGRQAVERTE